MNHVPPNKIQAVLENVKTVFPKLPVSTQTIIAFTNCQFFLPELCRYLPLVDETLTRVQVEAIMADVSSNRVLTHGCIVTIQNREELRGVNWKATKRKATRTKSYFLNSITIVMMLQQPEGWKKINCKISKGGNLQLTGCKTYTQYLEFFGCLMRLLVETRMVTGEKLFQVHNGTNVAQACYQVVMRNLDYHIGFPISREKLDTFLTQQTDYTSMYEGSINTGVNVKIKCANPFDEEMYVSHFNTETLEHSASLYQTSQLMSVIPTIRKKQAYHTFLVFASGAIIQSGKGSDMRSIFQEFTTTLLQQRRQFEEHLLN